MLFNLVAKTDVFDSQSGLVIFSFRFFGLAGCKVWLLIAFIFF